MKAQARCSFLLLWMLACVADAGHAAFAQERRSAFTPACAARDIQALDTIEQFGDLDEMPVAWLRDAGMSWLEARTLCMKGNEAAGLALYDRIIAGDVRLSAAVSARLGMN